MCFRTASRATGPYLTRVRRSASVRRSDASEGVLVHGSRIRGFAAGGLCAGGRGAAEPEWQLTASAGYLRWLLRSSGRWRYCPMGSARAGLWKRCSGAVVSPQLPCWRLRGRAAAPGCPVRAAVRGAGILVWRRGRDVSWRLVAGRERRLPGLGVCRETRGTSQFCDTPSKTPNEAAETDVLDKHGVDPTRPYVIFVGRITRQKGVPVLLRAAASLDPSAQLVLCAGAADTPELGAEVASLVAGLQSSRSGVLWIPEMLPKPEIIQLLTHALAVRVPVDLRAARDREPGGDGLRDRRRGIPRRRHPRGGRRGRDRAARTVE